MRSIFVVFLFTSCFFVQVVQSKTDDSSDQLRGVVDGIDVVLYEAVFADKVLQIQTKGEGGFKANLSVHLPIENGVVPEQKKFSEDGKRVFTGGTFRKQVSVSYYWKELESGKMVHSFMKRGEYQVEVEFGKETPKEISGRLTLKNAELDIKVAGNFIAEIRGLRLVDGHPDLQCDHRDTLIYAGELFLRKKLKSESAKLSYVMDCKYHLKAGDKKAGWLDGKYKDGDGKAVFIRLQFVKDDEGWRVFQELRADQLVAAHPIVPFDITKVEDDDGMMISKIFDFLTAKALEADVQKEFPGKGFSPYISFGSSFSRKTGIGCNQVRYGLQGEKKQSSKTYLFRRVDGLWQVERALKDGEKVNTRTGKVEQFVASGGKTLYEAVAKGETKLVKTLLKKGADVNAKNTRGVTPLVCAAAGGYEKIVKMLIGGGADVNTAAKDGRRALCIAVARGDSGIVKLLVKAKVDVNIKNGSNSTVLHTAAVWDRHEITEMLIKAGADVNAIDGGGRSVLDLARWWGSERAAKLLKVSGAKIVKAGQENTSFMGRVHGMDIVVGEAQIDNGRYVQFYGSKGRTNPPKVTIYLNGEHGVLPIGKSFKINHSDARGTGHVSNIVYEFSTKSKGNDRSERLGRKGYDLQLTFGEEKDGMLEGEVLLESPEKDVRLKGDFKAKIKGLRMVDGHPDIRSDSMETLRYAAKLYLQDKLTRDDVAVSKARGDYNAWLSDGDKIGGVDVNYKVGDNSEQFLRVQLRKGADGWKVVRELKGNELHTSHPLTEINKKKLSDYFLYLVSQRLEKDLQEEDPNSKFRTELHVRNRSSRKHGVAQAELKYWVLGTDKRHSRKYLLRRVEDDWVVERMLSDDEKLNTKTGTIEKK